MNILDKIDQMVELQQATKQPFNYSIPFSAGVAAAATTPASVSIQSDSHFLCRFMNVTVYASSGSIPLVVLATQAALDLALLDSGAGRNMQDNAQPIQNLCGGVAAAGGTGSLPFVWPEPWLIRASGSVQATLTNIGRETYPRVVISLIGFKVYRWGGGGPPEGL